jgi:hypothetical protein
MSGKAVIHLTKNPSATHAKASLALTAALVDKENVPPSQALTTDDSATQEGPQDDTSSMKTSSKSAIKNVVVREDEFLCEVGLNALIWLHYEQVKDSYPVQLFLEKLTLFEWEKFFLEREETIEAGSLELDICDHLQMKSWGRQWVFEVEAKTVGLNQRDVEVMGLVNDAEFC